MGGSLPPVQPQQPGRPPTPPAQTLTAHKRREIRPEEPIECDPTPRTLPPGSRNPFPPTLLALVPEVPSPPPRTAEKAVERRVRFKPPPGARLPIPEKDKGRRKGTGQLPPHTAYPKSVSWTPPQRREVRMRGLFRVSGGEYRNPPPPPRPPKGAVRARSASIPYQGSHSLRRLRLDPPIRPRTSTTSIGTSDPAHPNHQGLGGIRPSLRRGAFPSAVPPPRPSPAPPEDRRMQGTAPGEYFGQPKEASRGSNPVPRLPAVYTHRPRRPKCPPAPTPLRRELRPHRPSRRGSLRTESDDPPRTTEREFPPEWRPAISPPDTGTLWGTRASPAIRGRVTIQVAGPTSPVRPPPPRSPVSRAEPCG